MALSTASDGGVSIITAPSAEAENSQTIDDDASLDDTQNGIDAASLLNEARKLINANAEVYIKRLAEAVTIQSVSTDLSKRDDCIAMADLLHRWIEELGGRSEKVLVGFQELDDGQRFDLPSVILAEFHDGPPRNGKPTVLVYGHYDVQPAESSDGWSSDPFHLTERDDLLYARGTFNNKGPILAWLWAVEVFRELATELPVNLKICLEGMEESNSECLHDLLERETARNGFLTDIDYAIFSNSNWLTPHKPCLTYGLRGLATFQCEVRAGSKTLNSGQFGGCITEPMTDIIQLLAAVSQGGHLDIDVPSCRREDCAQMTDSEHFLYKGISFDTDTFRSDAGNVTKLIGESSTEVLMNRWRWPSLSIHGIEGGHNDTGFKPVIPGSVTGKFSIRLVPGQEAANVEKEVTELLRHRFDELQSNNELIVTTSVAEPWIVDPKGPLYQAGGSALLKVYGIRPDFIREGGSIPVVGMLQNALSGADIMLLPLGTSEDAPSSENEFIGRKNYVTGINVFFVLLLELARIHAEQKAADGVQTKRGAFGRLRDIWYGLS